ncbi:bifunctional aminoglycoside phosphotransferase/ATP-binding protein [Methylobacter sp.]|uniref:bifunctional aminoglycoside phosphotransferase/ATP-binding protein n=1 Tax=Methylobacter sp. TaxID=2051955 RepID=UPI002488BD70|nr:bifunctional aminoglycoside phosphotransferase/ATP-binding protein [Methylobacter sp.]MDI1277910.1 AAA family ATPase [Methylobacter sp.]MDI1358704.1 AAA family ATPase [Methylobacter sp.]
MANNTALNSSLTLIKALSEAYACNIVETHISWVLLTDQYVYKIKKPVNFGFLDFSTLEKRRFCCTEELRLNRRLAADLYLEVVPITGTPQHPKIGGTGAAIEYAVKMIRFPSGQLLSEHAGRGQLGTNEIDQLADIVADFHETSEQTDENSPYGDSANINHWFVENFDHIRPLLVDDDQKQQLQRIQQWGDSEWRKQAGLMQLRRQQGSVRECHGDLHLGNMTLINDKVTLFDCIEFNPMLRWVDVISEVAFLFIDLLHFGYDRHAYRFLNRYLQHTGDYQGLALLRYYLVYRALVRAKVSLLRMAQQPDDDAVAKQARCDYAVFADLAERFTKRRPIVLIITHGYSGSGKSTMAAQLAEKIGAFQIRSDIERKRLFGYRALVQTGSGIDDGLYTQEVSLKTYQHLKELAKAVLDAGFPAIIDAAFLKTRQRDPFRQLAADCGVPFHIITFQASDQELCRRIRQRQEDASEATVAVLHHQQQSAQPLSEQEQSSAIPINTESDNAGETLLNTFDRYLQ